MYFKRFVFEPAALKTEYGRELYDKLSARGLEPAVGKGREASCADGTAAFRAGKRTLIIGSRSPSRFETCRPSADFQLPVLTGCPGQCEYCYLMTRMGERSYVKLNANIVNIFTNIDKYIEQSLPKRLSFELSASSDPLPFEKPTGIVSKMIEHFAALDAQLRICTKFEPEESILKARHAGHTAFRFSLNTPRVIGAFEHATPDLSRRLAAASRIIGAGYRTGIMIAPVFLDGGWESEYSALLDCIAEEFKKSGAAPATFEAVTHRYTARAKETVARIFPGSDLDMDDAARKFKMGQFGYGKYVYDSEKLAMAKDFFREEIAKKFPDSKLLYVV